MHLKGDTIQPYNLTFKEIRKLFSEEELNAEQAKTTRSGKLLGFL